LLPNTAEGLMRIVDFPAVSQAWKKTSLAALADDPSMQPFWEAQQQSRRRALLNAGIQVGLRWADLEQIASGEVLASWISFPDPKRPFAVSLIADIRGRAAPTRDVMEQLDQLMKQREATRRDVQYRGQTIRVYTLQRDPGEIEIEQIALTIGPQRLIASDRQVVVEQFLDSVAGKLPQQRLVDAKDYQRVLKRINAPTADEVHWFARPLPFARIVREVANTDRGNRVDIVQLLESQGFDAVQAGGGRIEIGTPEYDLLHHGFILAPRPAGATERFRLAARMLQFPNQTMEPLPAWIGEATASCLRLNWAMEKAFWAAETLVDEAFGDPIFRPTLEGIEEDPEGPQIDIPNQVIGHFGTQLILVTDNVAPAAVDSERMLIAVRLDDVTPVAEAVRKAMESEPDATRLETLPEQAAWKVVPREEPLDFEEELFEDFGFEADVVPQQQRAAPLLEQWAITVVPAPLAGGDGKEGFLMFSSHAEMLVDAVQRIEQNAAGGLSEQEDVEQVFGKIKALGGDSLSLVRVNRLSRSLRTKYQLLRQGKLRESDSFLASLLRQIADGDKPAFEPENRSAAKLPPFEAIEGYLKAAGSFMKTEEDGWSLVGFLLSGGAPSDGPPSDGPPSDGTSSDAPAAAPEGTPARDAAAAKAAPNGSADKGSAVRK
jgi:hypothetical protein